MDLQSRGQQPAQAHAPAGRPNAARRKSRGKLFRVFSVLTVLMAALLIAALAFLIATGGTKDEKDFVDNSKFQAVFLNGGQVYFGKIRDLNNQYLTIDNIYYLRVNEQVQPNTETENEQRQQDISLAKLGCELHRPQDKMIINRDQMTFWENLESEGQVAKAIEEFIRQNPDGQKCAEPQS